MSIYTTMHFNKSPRKKRISIDLIDTDVSSAIAPVSPRKQRRISSGSPMSCIDDYPEPEVIVSKEDSNEDTPGSGRTKLTFRLKEGRMRNPVLLLPQSFVFPKGDSSYETTKKPSMFLFGNEFAIKVGMLLSFATPSSCYSGNVFRDLDQRNIAITFNVRSFHLIAL